MQRLYPSVLKTVILTSHRSVHGSRSFPVVVVGAAGGIGQPLSLLIRQNPLVSRLTLYDLKHTVGVAADLSHIDVMGDVVGREGPECLKQILKCAEIVVIPAGMPRKPGQSRDDLFKVNVDVITQIMDVAAVMCPKAFFAIITNPVNSTVPAAAEVLKKHGVYDPARLFGVTTLDIVRARKFIADYSLVDTKKIKVQVIGGHSAETMVPILSSSRPDFKGDPEDMLKIAQRIKVAGNEVVEAKAGAGSATLSMAHAGALFVNSLLKAKNGDREVQDIAYVQSNETDAPFFASLINLGPDGVKSFEPLPEMDQCETSMLCEAVPKLIEDIKKGVEHGNSFEITKPKGKC